MSNIVVVNIFFEGKKVTEVPFAFFASPICFKGFVVTPSLYSASYSLFFLKLFNFKFSDKAFTTETPTPCYPHDILYES